MAEEFGKELSDKPPRADSPPAGPILFYNEIVIEHFTNPRNVGELEKPDGEATVGDPSCGDQMKLSIKVDNKIVEIKFKSYGCPGAIATSSMVTELAKGKSTDEALMITDDDVVVSLGGLPEQKKHCSLLGVRALRAAIEEHLNKAKVQHCVDLTGDLCDRRG